MLSPHFPGSPGATCRLPGPAPPTCFSGLPPTCPLPFPSCLFLFPLALLSYPSVPVLFPNSASGVTSFRSWHLPGSPLHPEVGSPSFYHSSSSHYPFCFCPSRLPVCLLPHLPSSIPSQLTFVLSPVLPFRVPSVLPPWPSLYSIMVLRVLPSSGS